MFAAVAWACAVGGTALAVPQFARIVKGRSSAGVSLLAWQLWATIGLAWAVHGAASGSLSMLVPNLFSALFSTCILVMIARERSLGWVETAAVPLVVSAVAIALRLGIGPVTFSVFMLLPQAIAVLGQLFDLVRAADLDGVSMVYLHTAVAMQGLWLSYGIIGRDLACTISSVMMIVLVSANLLVYALRYHGRLVAHPSFARVPVYG